MVEDDRSRARAAWGMLEQAGGLVGTSDLPVRLGSEERPLSAHRVRDLVRSDGFPEPVIRRRPAGNLWLGADVDAWKREHRPGPRRTGRPRHPALPDLPRAAPRGAGRWLPEEDEQLIAAYLAGESFEAMAALLGAEVRTIRTRVSRLRDRGEDLPLRLRRWTPEERDLLAKRRRQSASLTELEREFGVARSTLTSQLRYLRAHGYDLGPPHLVQTIGLIKDDEPQRQFGPGPSTDGAPPHAASDANGFQSNTF